MMKTDLSSSPTCLDFCRHICFQVACFFSLWSCLVMTADGLMNIYSVQSKDSHVEGLLVFY